MANYWIFPIKSFLPTSLEKNWLRLLWKLGKSYWKNFSKRVKRNEVQVAWYNSTFAYGAKKSRAVICNLNFPVFENLPKQVPKLIRFSLPIFVALFMISSLKKRVNQSIPVREGNISMWGFLEVFLSIITLSCCF